jgi:dolichol kinase
MVFNLIALPITILFIAIGFIQLIFAIKLKKKFPKDHNFINSFIIFLLWIISGVLYPFFYPRNSPSVQFHQSFSMSIICLFAPLLVILVLLYQSKVVLKDKTELRENRTIEKFLEKYNLVNVNQINNKSYSLRTDFHRKIFHLLPGLVIIILRIFAIDVWDGLWNADLVYGITGYEYGAFLILTIGYAGVILFAALDLIRLSFIFENSNLYHLLPDCLSNLLIKTLKKNENYEFTKNVVLVLSLVPLLFLPFGIFTAVALITSIGDGVASIIGISFGKRHFPKTSSKTMIGYISGVLASFGVSVLSLWLFEPYLMPLKIIIMSLSGALVFLIIDLLSLEIDDNILNPIFCGLIMMFFYFIL